MKIGLVTLHDYNYGSAIQCFASQKYIEKNYCECELIQNRNRHRLINILSTIYGYCSLLARNPLDCKNIIQHIKSQRSKNLTISQRSLKEISRFNQLYLRKRFVTNSEMRRADFLAEYDYFFSGSDQVWNGSRVNSYDMFFLRFAPSNKRVAWAPSFGSGDLASYNVKLYQKYISSYSRLSVREESGQSIIEDLTGRNAVLLCDPVVLLTADEWKEHYSKKSTLVFDSNSILLFFIDEISDDALKKVISLQEKTDLPVYSFGYCYEKYERINRHTHLDGSPFDFLKVLDQCSFVMTDSFHATVFSMLFHSEFYTFTRKYTHKQNQSTRIESLLNRIGAIDRFNPDDFSSPIDFERCDEYFNAQRLISDDYLTSILGEKNTYGLNENRYPTLFEEKHECTGCGACVDACPKNCIEFKLLDDNALYPFVNQAECIGCKKCESVCHIKNYQIKRNCLEMAKVGFCKDDSLYNNSASGGIFAAIADSFLKNNGVVYGASLTSDKEGVLQCRHVRIEKESDLIKILNSKYVQSDTLGVFNDIKELLQTGTKVLFSGTSCQVAGLFSFLKKEYSNLYTVDLICHGVPGGGMLNDYISYIRTKDYEMDLLAFRVKRDPPYTLVFSDSNEINMRDSAYYRMFMAQANYRKGCYACRYAHRNKPADITLGDFYDKAKLKELSISSDDVLYSSVLVRTEKGKCLLDMIKENTKLVDFDFDAIVNCHANLISASMVTPSGSKLMQIYSKNGFRGVQKYIVRRNRIVDFFKILKK